jgi:thiosulfate/3-mercaptopyruvate sulfurtransferase
MSSTPAPYLLTPQELLRKLSGSPDKVAVLDTSWFMPNSPRSGIREYQEKRIPNAQFIDLDEVASEHELGLKHMMPSGQVFAKACGEEDVVGISR